MDTTDAANHKVIAEVDWDSAFTTVHDDAIYMVESQQYHVDYSTWSARRRMSERWMWIITPMP